jgi:N-acylneuraminate cytidylyltransferase
MENGAFYITRRKLLEESGCRLGGRIGCYVLPDHHATELDEPEDWLHVERILVRRASVHRLQAMVFDVDGTLTDGTGYYTAEGEQAKRFSLRDGKGFELLKAAGIRAVLCTQEVSPIVAARARKLGLNEILQGEKDKGLAIKELSARTGIPLAEIGYMGDDINDLPAMKIVGWSACPADAHPDVCDQVQFRSRLRGGAGAAREVCDFLVSRAAR